MNTTARYSMFKYFYHDNFQWLFCPLWSKSASHATLFSNRREVFYVFQSAEILPLHWYVYTHNLSSSPTAVTPIGLPHLDYWDKSWVIVKWVLSNTLPFQRMWIKMCFLFLFLSSKCTRRRRLQHGCSFLKISLYLLQWRYSPCVCHE